MMPLQCWKQNDTGFPNGSLVKGCHFKELIAIINHDKMHSQKRVRKKLEAVVGVAHVALDLPETVS